jgi:tRNA1Val (adenine37-N6)-methyltransferase
MNKPPFRFKQFSVAQEKCAMKVNTDGVLLGAWADMDGAESILDIGTGTGVIALMMAQRNANAIIDAIDIDRDAFAQSGENFLNSLWSERLYAHHVSLQDYFPEKKYDLIISNPPYFVDDFKTEDHQKNIAKHSVSLSYQELITGINRLLSDTSSASLVLPAFNLPLFESLASAESLFVIKLTEVIAVEGKSPYLVLIKLGRKQVQYSKNNIVIQNKEGIFTKEYKELTKDFYLKF